ncbi:hypothetical protein ACIO3O_37060 [Streptomyces sp. NPDC087440]|uniref:hypothetical protein n=1 Tax=Streptomyces sp. NPDC087440 TaxID=3365790 RepID=UPI00381FD508
MKPSQSKPQRSYGAPAASMSVPQVCAAISVLNAGREVLAVFEPERDACVASGIWLDPRRATGEVVLAYCVDDWFPGRPFAEPVDLAEREARVTVCARLFREAGWQVEEYREYGRMGVKRLERLVLTPPTPHGEVEGARLKAVAESLGVAPEDLDDAVHDAFARQSAAVNNGGIDRQIGYLVAQFGAEETEAIIHAAAGS